jgi:hypothetical protein
MKVREETTTNYVVSVDQKDALNLLNEIRSLDLITHITADRYPILTELFVALES